MAPALPPGFFGGHAVDLLKVEAYADHVIRKMSPTLHEERIALGGTREVCEGILRGLLALASSIAMAQVECPDHAVTMVIHHAAEEARAAMIAAQRTVIARIN